MSNQTSFTQSRRNFLKGAAYTSALSIGGLSSIAFATTSSTKGQVIDSLVPLSENGISVMSQNMLHKDTVSLINNTDQSITLDALHPITIERVNGSYLVKPNRIESNAYNGMIMILPRQRISFDIQTTGGAFSSAEVADVSKLSGQYLHITSEHSAFNKLIPVSNAETSWA